MMLSITALLCCKKWQDQSMKESDAVEDVWGGEYEEMVTCHL